MKFDIKNRFTGKVQFTAEIKARKNASEGVKIGLAVKWAYETGADLRDANLGGADLTGAYLRDADLRDANLRDADLRGADLTGADLRGAYLRDANLTGANLTGANLRGANLRDADLRGADLRDACLTGAYLRGADLRGAKSIPPVPKIKNLDGKILAAIKTGGELDMSHWHGPEDNWCGTTHCRAGWAIHEAGKKGRVLENAVGCAAAGALIYAKAYPDLPVPDFYCGYETALKDIKKRAALA